MTTVPHLDDETISAALDGELRDDEAERARSHLDACADCAARFTAFGDVAAWVAALDVAAPSAEVQDAAIARALAETGSDADAAGERDTVRALRPRSRRNWAPVYAVAAVLALLLVAVPLVGSLSSDGSDDDVAAGSGSDTAALESSGRGSAGGGSAALVDLGPLDSSNLPAVVGDRLGAPVAMAAPPGAAGGAPTAADDGGATAATGERAEGLADDSGAGGAPGGAAGDTLTAERARACADDLDAEGAVALVARATWDGEPAAVLVYRQGDDVSAYVVDPAACSILHFVRFRARS